MQLFGKKSAVSTRLSSRVRGTLEKEYRLDAETLDRLHSVEKSGRFLKRSVRFLAIFDPAKVPAGKSIKQYEDLMTNREALVFEGHMEMDGTVYLSRARASTPAG